MPLRVAVMGRLFPTVSPVTSRFPVRL
jgi:hypothetical protein